MVDESGNQFAARRVGSVITEKDYSIELRWVWGSFIFQLLLVVLFTVVYDFEVIWSGLMLSYAIGYGLIFTYLRRRNFKYALEEHFLRLKQGVLNKQQRELPYGVIQNVYMKQNILDRLLGLASVVLENAAEGGGGRIFLGMTISGNNSRKSRQVLGFKGNLISIPGLKKENAELLKEAILKKIKENPIDDRLSGL